LSPGQPTARKAQLPSGNRTAQEANAGAPKGSRKPGQTIGSSAEPRITDRIRAYARSRKGADVGRVSP
jgi:hypothetical protein